MDCVRGDRDKHAPTSPPNFNGLNGVEVVTWSIVARVGTITRSTNNKKKKVNNTCNKYHGHWDLCGKWGEQQSSNKKQCEDNMKTNPNLLGPTAHRISP